MNLHYPLLQFWCTYENSDAYQCQRAGTKAKDQQKSTVTVLRQGPNHTAPSKETIGRAKILQHYRYGLWVFPKIMVPSNHPF